MDPAWVTPIVIALSAAGGFAFLGKRGNNTASSAEDAAKVLKQISDLEHKVQDLEKHVGELKKAEENER